MHLHRGASCTAASRLGYYPDTVAAAAAAPTCRNRHCEKENKRRCRETGREDREAFAPLSIYINLDEPDARVGVSRESQFSVHPSSCREIMPFTRPNFNSGLSNIYSTFLLYVTTISDEIISVKEELSVK